MVNGQEWVRTRLGVILQIAGALLAVVGVAWAFGVPIGLIVGGLILVLAGFIAEWSLQPDEDQRIHIDLTDDTESEASP